MMRKTFFLIITFVFPSFYLSGQEDAPLKQLDYIDLCDVEEKLSNWRGRIVFISFWSRTCGPCIRGFKRHQKLRNQLTEEGIVFLNVSIDRKEDWVRAYERYKPVGLNAMCKSFEQAQDDFEIFNLPVYVTIDEAGEMVVYDKMQYGNILDFVAWMKDREGKKDSE